MSEGDRDHTCRICGCDDEELGHSVNELGEPCTWVKKDGPNSLCSSCEDVAKTRKRGRRRKADMPLDEYEKELLEDEEDLEDDYDDSDFD